MSRCTKHLQHAQENETNWQRGIEKFQEIALTMEKEKNFLQMKLALLRLEKVLPKIKDKDIECMFPYPSFLQILIMLDANQVQRFIVDKTKIVDENLETEPNEPDDGSNLRAFVESEISKMNTAGISIARIRQINEEASEMCESARISIAKYKSINFQ